MKSPPSVDGIIAARASIDSTFLNSPLVEQASANIALGHRLFAKVETLNPIRSFKGRGAHWYLASLAPSARPIVTASAGNFGQGIAYAAASGQRSVIVFASVHANPRKLDAMRQLGARVILEGADFDGAKQAARAFAGHHDCVFVEDGDEPTIAEGAGTIAAELMDALAERAVALDAIIVPLGNGALLTGVATWIKAKAPACKVIGVVATGAPAMKLSWEQGRHIDTPTAVTAADGIAVRVPVDYALACMEGLVDQVVEVDEAAILAAMAFCRRHYGLVVEAAGAAGIAALLGTLNFDTPKVLATILCGGNSAEIDPGG
ncbi:MAG: pyridoxal-phosphate dependent enzyme [Pseudomonadota bacterium]